MGMACLPACLHSNKFDHSRVLVTKKMSLTPVCLVGHHVKQPPLLGVAGQAPLLNAAAGPAAALAAKHANCSG